MNEAMLFTLFIGLLREGLTLRGATGVEVMQAFQPTQQGMPSGPSIQLFILGLKRYGSAKRLDEWDPEAGDFVHLEKQQYTGILQVQATATRNPADPDALTETDLVTYAGDILQSDWAIRQMQAVDVGVARVQDVRNPFFSTDKDRHESAPLFELPISFKRVSTWRVPVVSSIEPEIHRI